LVGSPTHEFADALGLSWPLKMVIKFLSHSERKKAKKMNVSFMFLFMKEDGRQLGQITDQIEQGIIKPVIDNVFPFEQTNEALDYILTRPVKGKVVIKVR